MFDFTGLCLGEYRDLGDLVLRYTRDATGAIVDGRVEVLHIAYFEEYVVSGTGPSISHTVHAFSPTCAGEAYPRWRKPSDPGFPTSCAYDGIDRGPIATGSLDTAADVITWDACDSPDYWSMTTTPGDAYELDDITEGPGCLGGIRTLGSVHCASGGYLATCDLGGLCEGDNLIEERWNQPLVTGTTEDGDPTLPATGAGRDLLVSRGFGSPYDGYMRPLRRAAPRPWYFGIRATRDDASPHTTCD